MQSRLPVIVYNQENLIAWDNELLALQKQVTTQTQRLNEYNFSLQPLQNRLHNLNAEIIQVQLLLANFSRTEYRYDYCASGYTSTVHPYPKNGYHDGWDALADGVEIASKIGLNLKLSQLESEKKQLRLSMAVFEKQISQANQILLDAHNRMEWIEKHRVQGKEFLENLRLDTQLANKLSEKILKAFYSYDDEHPAGKTPVARICLYEIQEKLHAILTEDTTRLYPDYYPLQTAVQHDYLKLCAFLWEMYQHVLGKDALFEAVLAQLITETHVEIGGNLPDEFQVPTVVNDILVLAKNRLRNKHYVGNYQFSLLEMTENDLSVIEPKLFHQEIERITPLLHYENGLQKKVAEAVFEIKNEVLVKEKKAEFVDYAFYRTAVHDLNNLLTSSDKEPAANRIGFLAQHALGLPSVKKKVCGSLAIVAGALLVASSVACLIATFGSSALPSAIGLALGIGLLESQLTLGVGAAFGLVGGMRMTLFGVNQFKSGMRQGVCESLSEVENETLGAHIKPTMAHRFCV